MERRLCTHVQNHTVLIWSCLHPENLLNFVFICVKNTRTEKKAERGVCMLIIWTIWSSPHHQIWSGFGCKTQKTAWMYSEYFIWVFKYTLKVLTPSKVSVFFTIYFSCFEAFFFLLFFSVSQCFLPHLWFFFLSSVLYVFVPLMVEELVTLNALYSTVSAFIISEWSRWAEPRITFHVF